MKMLLQMEKHPVMTDGRIWSTLSRYCQMGVQFAAMRGVAMNDVRVEVIS